MMKTKVYGLALILLFTLTATAQSIQTAPFKSVNSPYDELNPVIGPDALYFTVANHPQNIGGKKDLGDIWVSVWVGGTWSKPIHGGNIIKYVTNNSLAGFSPQSKPTFFLNPSLKKKTPPPPQKNSYNH